MTTFTIKKITSVKKHGGHIIAVNKNTVKQLTAVTNFMVKKITLAELETKSR